MLLILACQKGCFDCKKVITSDAFRPSKRCNLTDRTDITNHSRLPFISINPKKRDSTALVKGSSRSKEKSCVHPEANALQALFRVFRRGPTISYGSARVILDIYVLIKSSSIPSIAFPKCSCVRSYHLAAQPPNSDIINHSQTVMSRGVACFVLLDIDPQVRSSVTSCLLPASIDF